MMYRVKNAKPAIGITIAAWMIGAGLNGLYVIAAVSESLFFAAGGAVSFALGLLGIYMTVYKRKQAFLWLLSASVILALLKFSGSESLMPCISGICVCVCRLSASSCCVDNDAGSV